METWQVIALGCAGGALPDVLRVIERRYEPAPDYLKRPFFWVSLGLLVCLGGGAAYFLSPTRIVDALAIGFSAPSLISGLLGQKSAAPRRATPSELKRIELEAFRHLRYLKFERKMLPRDLRPPYEHQEKEEAAAPKPLEGEQRQHQKPPEPQPRPAVRDDEMWRIGRTAPSLFRSIRQWWGGDDPR
ncbi:MAG: hypothetical protein QOF41_66 [Methylobacteriaceae bacterium]|nr:hypothetical protein [Methylobacteriaceae bacterium]